LPVVEDDVRNFNAMAAAHHRGGGARSPRHKLQRALWAAGHAGFRKSVMPAQWVRQSAQVAAFGWATCSLHRSKDMEDIRWQGQGFGPRHLGVLGGSGECAPPKARGNRCHGSEQHLVLKVLAGDLATKLQRTLWAPARSNSHCVRTWPSSGPSSSRQIT
jgi:hypothetical protein